MKIVLNGVEIDTSAPSLDKLLIERSIDAKGIAVGVNNKVIQRQYWSSVELSQGDKITVIRATCGG